MMVSVKSPANDREESWREWAKQAQAGDKAAYTLLLKDIVPFIRSVVMPTLANPDWVDDVTQDVLISVHKSLNTYSADRPFRPWLSTIIHFRRTDFLRRHYGARDNKRTTLENVDFQREHVTNSPFAGELKDIEKALDTLSGKQRKVFELIKIEGYTPKEVAGQMDMSVSAVKVSVHRSMKKLKGMLKEENGKR